jgi:hypothetical protein
VTTPAIAGDVRFFVLGDEGLLFSESRQELYALNASATLLWCLLEDGTTVAGLVERYADIFGLDRPHAAAHVHAALRRWFAAGHLTDPQIDRPGTMPFAEALACLLTNRSLRDVFRESPDGVAAAIGMDAEDARAFVTLDPGEVDRFATEIAESKHRQRFTPGPAVASLDQPERFRTAASLAHPRHAVVRFVRLIGTTFRLSLPAAFDAVISAAFEHLAADSAAVPDVSLEIGESARGVVVLDGIMPLAWCPHRRMVVPVLKLLLRTLAVSRRSYFMEVHAGVVLVADAVVLLPGSAGRGKTTLTAGLLRRGARYFSDEIALLESDSLDVRPVPVSMTIKPGSIPPLQQLYPGLGDLDEHLREDRQPVRYLAPPPEARCPADQPPRPARWVVFPRYEEGGDTLLSPVSPARGLQRLLDESLVLPELLDRHKVERLVEWARQLSFVDLRMSSLEAGVQAVLDLPRAT